LNTYQGAKFQGFSEVEETLVLSSILQRIFAGTVAHSIKLTADEFGRLAAKAFLQGGKVHDLLRQYKAA